MLSHRTHRITIQYSRFRGTKCTMLLLKIFQITSPFKDRKATIVAQTLASHNLPANRARELIKPSTDSASLPLEIE